MRHQPFNRIVVLPLLGCLLTFGAVSSAVAQSRDEINVPTRDRILRQQERREPREPRFIPNREVEVSAQPRQPERQIDQPRPVFRAEQPREQAPRSIPWERPVPRISSATPTANDDVQQERRPWLNRRDGNADGRRENWGDLARQQRERQLEDDRQRADTDTPPPRPWVQQPRPLPTQRPEPLPSPNVRPSSPLSDVIQQARQQDARIPPPRPDVRISQAEQRQRIDQQRRQEQQWRRDEDRRYADWDRHTSQLQNRHRSAQYRYQQDYWRRWQSSQQHWNRHRFDYYRDPFFYTPNNYRYSYGNRWYYTNYYGVQLLQQAIQDGYREGWRAGRADRDDRWRFDYRGNFGYIDGSYGYYGYYVNLSDYQYYFRQGFERGYRDGYYERYQYGRYENGDANILPAILSMILAVVIL